MTAETGQMVALRLGGEVYGFEITKVREVIHERGITEVPNAPAFVEGVIDLRNQVIPVVDLARRLRVVRRDGGKRRIVILERERPLGVMVDDIVGVLEFDPASFDPLPEALEDPDSGGCVSSLIRSGEELIMVLDPEKILRITEHEMLEECELAPHAPPGEGDVSRSRMERDDPQDME